MSGFTFCLSWLETVKTKGEDSARREYFGRQLFYDTEAEAEAERAWYAANPPHWAPAHACEVEVSDVKRRYTQSSLMAPKRAAEEAA